MQTFSTYWPATLTLTALSIPACGGTSAPSEIMLPPVGQQSLQTFVGSLEGTDAVVGIVQKGELWAGYVCGGRTSYATLTSWYEGSVARTELIEPNGNLSARWADGALTGTLLGRDGVSRNFRANPVLAGAGTVLGLFEAVDSGCRAGFVAMPSPSGQDSVTQGVWCDRAGRFEQVTPILPIALGERGVLVHVSQYDRQFYVVPAVPPLGSSLRE